MLKRALLIPVVAWAALGGAAIGGADSLHVAADATVSEQDPNRTFGAEPSVTIQDTGTYKVHGYVRFDLSPLGHVPAGTPVGRAVLRLWVGSPVSDGYVAVHPVLAGWDESTITWNSMPGLGSALTSLKVTRDDERRYFTIDVTSLVQDWVDGRIPNEGLALLPDTPGIQLELDSKESTATSHPMELEVVLEDANSGGDVTAVNTPAGSGLQGGAASGDATLGLLTGCAAGQILKWTGTAWACAADAQAGPGAGWSLTGNAGTTAGTNFLGTTDNQALELRVNGARAVRIDPNPDSPIFLSGYQGNSIASAARGAVIAGGGAPGHPNQIGGYGEWSTIGGGFGNVITIHHATIAGGNENLANSDGATVGGGEGNRAGNFNFGVGPTVSGGSSNTAAGEWSTVPGGLLNYAGGNFSFAAGHRAKVRDGDGGTFAWADNSGGPVSFFTSTGPNQFLVRAVGGVAINTNTPAAGNALTVNGNTTMTGNASTSGTLSFGAATRQMINLWDTRYAIGVQAATTYFRSDNGYAWYMGGVHHDGQNNPGGGTRQMRLDFNGNLFVRGTVSGGGADFAEMLLAQDGAEPGDVLAIGADGRLVLSTEPYQDSLAGIYSTRPGLLGGAADGEDLTGKIPLAVAGVIPVKVTDENGPIAPGDALTSSSTPGRAMKATKIRIGKAAFYPSGVILGKALESHTDGEGVIQALVVLQ